MIIQTTSKHLIELTEELAKDLKKDQDLTSVNKLLILESSINVALCLLNEAEDFDSVDKIRRIKAEFKLYLTLIEDYEE